jgi:TetR/AcrR family transcriptional regulator, repressor for neighboring sulfatase
VFLRDLTVFQRCKIFAMNNIVNSEGGALRMSGKRMRRTPEEARRHILDAAEASMASRGPAGIRLQDVARSAGVSHSNVLHHFGSRAGLIEALNRRTVEDLKSVLFEVMRAAHSSTEDIIGPAFAAYRNGLAQRTLWVLQGPTRRGAQTLPVFEEIVEALHTRLLSNASPRANVDKDDIRAIVHLTTIAAFGDALIGARLRQCNSADEPPARLRFEKWFGTVLDTYSDAIRGSRE